MAVAQGVSLGCIQDVSQAVLAEGLTGAGESNYKLAHMV